MAVAFRIYPEGSLGAIDWLVVVFFTCSLCVGQAPTGMSLGIAVSFSEQHPDRPSSEHVLTLGPGHLVIHCCGVGPNCALKSSPFVPLPGWGYQSKQMCINKKLNFHCGKTFSINRQQS